MTRSATSSITGSWVATIAVTPSARTTVRMSSMIRWPVSESSWPVGSSASRSRGRLASARAIATRCCSPPDSSCGRWRARVVEARRAPAAPRPARRARVGSAPTSRSGTSTFSAARQDRDQAERLEHERDGAAAHLGRLRPRRARRSASRRRRRVPGRRLVEAAEEVEQRRLAAARPAAHREQLAAGDVDVDAAERMDDRAAARVVAAQPARDDHRVGAGDAAPRGGASAVSRSSRPGPSARSSGRSARPLGRRARRRRGRPRGAAGPGGWSSSASTWARGSWSRPARSRTAYSSRDHAVVALVASAPSGAASRCSSGRRGSPPSAATCSDTNASWVTMTIVVPSSLVDPPQQAEHLLGRLAVELAGGLVGEDDASGRWRARRRSRPAAARRRYRRSGRCVARSARPTSVEQLERALRGAPSARRGSSAARRSRPPLRYGSRLRPVCCHTNPTTRRRKRVRSAFESRPRS